MAKPVTRRAPTVLLVGEQRAGRSAAAMLQAAGMACSFARSSAAACARDSDADQDVLLLCSPTLSRASAREVATLRSRFTGSVVVLLAARIAQWELRAALSAGASGVLIDDETLPACLVSCVHAALAGQVCVPRRHRQQIEPAALSRREKQILGLVVMGYMNCQIAERLYLAESTVKSHLSSAFGKLGVRSRHEAARLILDPEGGLGTGILALSDRGAPAGVSSPSAEAAALLSV